MISDLIYSLGPTNPMVLLAIGDGWLIAGVPNLALAWITGWFYRRQHRPGRRLPKSEVVIMSGLCFLVIVVALATLMLALENRSGASMILWLIVAWTTFVIGKQGFRKNST